MKKVTLIILTVLLSIFMLACPTEQQESDSGVKKASVKVQTDSNGQTTEQKNVIEKNKRDNSLGEVKHLYVISSYSGDVLEYSTVVGKITSGGKRLSPRTVIGGADGIGVTDINTVKIGNKTLSTNELIDEQGTYGSSSDYFYWFDAQGNYHQYFPSGGTYVHVSDKPLKPKKAIITFEVDSDIKTPVKKEEPKTDDKETEEDN